MDEIYMDIAINLAQMGEGKVNPNPLVGAVIVKDKRIIGMGYHEKYGKLHAERNAINSAVEDVKDSTIYVTLEPCAHFGKTPPCVNYIIEKKFKRVVIGMVDPNPLVAGKSIEKLRKNNIEVIVNVREKECRKMNEIFIKYITTKKPFILIKSGISLDGKIATVNKESKYITCEESRKDVHKLRNKYSAILVGINTVIEDDPLLTCRLKKEKIDILQIIKDNNLNVSEKLINSINQDLESRNPIRIILDSNLRIPIESRVIKENPENTILVTTENCDENKKRILEDKNVKILVTKTCENKVDLNDLMIKLGKMNIDSILVEGGGSVNFSMLEKKAADKVRFYIAPKIIGGENSKSCIGGKGVEKMADIINLKDIRCEKINDDIVVEGYI